MAPTAVPTAVHMQWIRGPSLGKGKGERALAGIPLASPALPPLPWVAKAHLATRALPQIDSVLLPCDLIKAAGVDLSQVASPVPGGGNTTSAPAASSPKVAIKNAASSAAAAARLLAGVAMVLALLL